MKLRDYIRTLRNKDRVHENQEKRYITSEKYKQTKKEKAHKISE